MSADGGQAATELAALVPDVIVASGSAGAAAVLQATRTVPTVFVIVPDPVGSGCVESLAQPGGTPLALWCSNTVWARNGWNCSKRSHRVWRGRGCFAIPLSPQGLACSAPSNLPRRRLEWR